MDQITVFFDMADSGMSNMDLDYTRYCNNFGFYHFIGILTSDLLFTGILSIYLSSIIPIRLIISWSTSCPGFLLVSLAFPLMICELIIDILIQLSSHL